MPVRGTYEFEIDGSSRLVASDNNLVKLRKLFRDDAIIGGEWGPSNPGDFDHGSWHILCHLAGGSGVIETAAGRAWCGITHVAQTDTYAATITHRESRASAAAAKTVPLGSTEAATAVAGAPCLGFIEGASLGHISARAARDADSDFNGWPRQMFDKDIASEEDGGTVWEHWSTTRDIRPSSAIGTSVLRAWLELVSRLGGRFVAAVARGRREHSHPTQLVALVRAGVLSEAEATWDVKPEPISRAAQDLLYQARPTDALAAVETLAFTEGQEKYFMFARRIDRWSPAARVKRDLGLD